MFCPQLVKVQNSEGTGTEILRPPGPSSLKSSHLEVYKSSRRGKTLHVRSRLLVNLICEFGRWSFCGQFDKSLPENKIEIEHCDFNLQSAQKYCDSTISLLGGRLDELAIKLPESRAGGPKRDPNS